MILIRILDLFLSIFFILILIPFFLIIGILIFLNDGFPILYISKRAGISGVHFNFYKFRTMNIKTLPNQPDEITSFGRYLRRTSLDELPQLFNVLSNKMSIVGPRPLPPKIEIQISKDLLQIRRSIKPGITGYSQILYNNKKRTWDEKINHDVKFVKKYSIITYLYVIFFTLPVLLRRFKFNIKGDSL